MPKETARLAAYSDAVFAVIVTIMVLELSCEQQRNAYKNSAAISVGRKVVFRCECRFLTQLGWHVAARVVRGAHGGW